MLPLRPRACAPLDRMAALHRLARLLSLCDAPDRLRLGERPVVAYGSPPRGGSSALGRGGGRRERYGEARTRSETSLRVGCGWQTAGWVDPRRPTVLLR